MDGDWGWVQVLRDRTTSAALIRADRAERPGNQTKNTPTQHIITQKRLIYINICHALKITR
jgi:hypothetical protein